jgi:hypothetical protein
VTHIITGQMNYIKLIKIEKEIEKEIEQDKPLGKKRKSNKKINIKKK